MAEPADNQLVNGTDLRAWVVPSRISWKTVDPGTGVLPNNKIVDGNFMTTYTNWSASLGNQCPTYLDTFGSP